MKKKLTKKTRLAQFEKFRSEGNNQKESAKLLGITEKTAGVYEKLRKDKKNKKIAEIDDLIARIKIRADSKKTSTKELIELTEKLEDLVIKRETIVDEI